MMTQGKQPIGYNQAEPFDQVDSRYENFADWK